MKLTGTWLLVMLLAGAAQAVLILVPGDKPAGIFSGKPSSTSVTFSNSSDQDFNSVIRTRIYQTSSATVAPVSKAAWKTLRVLPQQTVLESVRLNFPAVKAETKFVVQWLENTNRVIGTTEVWVYPTNLLGELKSLLKIDEFGVLDPNNELKPVLQQDGVPYLNLEEKVLEDFRGRLAIIGPFHSPAQMREGLAKSLQKIAAAGVAVVWLQPPGSPEEIMPSFYVVPGTKAAVVIAQADLTAHFAESPQSQLNLVRFCRLALNPEPFLIPYLAYQP